MKLRILNYRVTARHDLIVGLDSIRQAISISDFHALVYDSAGPVSDANYSNLDVQRRQAEVRDLINRKGGIVLFIFGRRLPRIGCWTLQHRTSRISYEATSGKALAHSLGSCSQ